MLRDIAKRKSRPYSPTILKNVLCLVVQIFLYLATFEWKTISDWLHRLFEMDDSKLLSSGKEFKPDRRQTVVGWTHIYYNYSLGKD